MLAFVLLCVPFSLLGTAIGLLLCPAMTVAAPCMGACSLAVSVCAGFQVHCPSCCGTTPELLAIPLSDATNPDTAVARKEGGSSGMAPPREPQMDSDSYSRAESETRSDTDDELASAQQQYEMSPGDDPDCMQCRACTADGYCVHCHVGTATQGAPRCRLNVPSAELCSGAADYVRFGLELAFACSAFGNGAFLEQQQQQQAVRRVEHPRPSATSPPRETTPPAQSKQPAASHPAAAAHIPGRSDPAQTPPRPSVTPQGGGVRGFACALCDETVNPLADRLHCCPTAGPGATFPRAERGYGVQRYRVHGQWLRACEEDTRERARLLEQQKELHLLLGRWREHCYEEHQNLVGGRSSSDLLTRDKLMAFQSDG
jgi:hypothetical protein